MGRNGSWPNGALRTSNTLKHLMPGRGQPGPRRIPPTTFFLSELSAKLPVLILISPSSLLCFVDIDIYFIFPARCTFLILVFTRYLVQYWYIVWHNVNVGTTAICHVFCEVSPVNSVFSRSKLADCRRSVNASRRK